MMPMKRQTNIYYVQNDLKKKKRQVNGSTFVESDVRRALTHI